MAKPRVLIALVIVLTFCLLAAWLPSRNAPAAAPAEPSGWEYKAVKDDEVLDGDDPSEERLDKLGGDGWELAGSYTKVFSVGDGLSRRAASRTVFLFKRPKGK